MSGTRCGMASNPSPYVPLTTGISAAYADDDRAITKEQLPKAAQEFLSKYFPTQKIALAKEETDFLDKTYEVIFVDGAKVEFSRNGEWKEVNCKFSAVPDGIVPAQILKYIDQNHEGAKVIEIDRDKRDWEVKLDNGLDLKFDLQFRLIEIDD